MSGEHFNGVNVRFAEELFGWGNYPSYGEGGFNGAKWAAKNNPLEDKEISEIAWDLLCVIHSYAYYASCDTSEEQYRSDVRYFKDKWLKPGRKETLKRLVDKSCDDLREELYKEIGIEVEKQ